MMFFTDFVAAINARSLSETNPEIVGVSTDTRSVKTGELFIALRGEHYNAHDFLDAAIKQGASAVMVDQAWAGTQAAASLPCPVLVVADTRLALGQLAAWWRSQFDIPLIGITGSNGKTTVKEMTAAILREQMLAEGRDPECVLATTGNLNNEIGLPMMLLRLRKSHRAAVIEMGMNHLGEIAYLTRLARPTVALVNNAQRAHLEGVGSLADIARAKGEIFEGLQGRASEGGDQNTGGIAVINADDDFGDYWRELSTGRGVLSFGLKQAADVRGDCTLGALGSVLLITLPSTVDTSKGSNTRDSIQVSLKVLGLHNARNALAAAAVSLAAGASLAAISEGLESFSGVKGRLQIRSAQHGATLIDDTYNANPDSVRAAIDVLAATPGKKILVLGDMGEIGEQTGPFHEEIGGYAKNQGIDLLLALGEQSALSVRSFGTGGQHFHNVDELVKNLNATLIDVHGLNTSSNTAVLVKGSRFMRMERVVDALVMNKQNKQNLGSQH